MTGLRLWLASAWNQWFAWTAVMAIALVIAAVVIYRRSS